MKARITSVAHSAGKRGAPGLALTAALLVLVGYAMSGAAESPRPTWVVDPAAPGDNLPPAGRSLFDQLFAVSRDGRAGVAPPFPFTTLLAHIDRQLAADPASPLPPAKRVLIPLGRSLQRSAAAPDYFTFPRIVVAVDAQPVSAAAPFLKDRLYIGYQEKSAILEVISYNEAAGRFEFQLVKDYRAGTLPRVVYANRSLCFACHQNGAPIFSRALWDETNANPQAAAFLAASGGRFHGIPVERGVDIPYAIDNATERANGFAFAQRLWREGCGDDDTTAHRCRAGLFAAALRHALSGGQTANAASLLQQEAAAQLRVQAKRRWPGGLALGNPDLPNRNPLQGLVSLPESADARIALSHVAARFDPLLPRPPQETWQPDAPAAQAGVAAALAEFIAEPDQRRIAAALARQPAVATEQAVAHCRIDVAPASRWSVACRSEAGLDLAGTLEVQGAKPVGGRLARLRLPGGTALAGLDLAADRSFAPALRFLPHRGGQPPRTAAGDAITALEFSRTGDATGEVHLTIRRESAAVDGAINTLATGPRSGELFGPGAFPRQALVGALLSAFGIAAAAPCCRGADSLPPPQLEVPAMAPGAPPPEPLDGIARDFHPYCAACHRTAEAVPPNFLAGNAAQVAARLRHCAPRLYVRLAMADLPAERRDKTPMPPETMLPAFATDAEGWRRSPARAALLAQVGAWLQAETGRPPDLGQILAGGYEALRPCLPAP